MLLGLLLATALIGGSADDLQFTDWTAYTNGNHVVTGTLLGQPVTMTSESAPSFLGPLDGSSTEFSGPDFTPPLAHADAPEFYGTTPAAPYTIAFGAPVHDPVLHLYSLASTITFPAGTRITKLSGQAGFDVSGNVVSGAFPDRNGTIQVSGDFSSIAFTVLWPPGQPDGVDLALGASPVPVATPAPTPTPAPSPVPIAPATPVPGVRVTSQVSSGEVLVRLPGASGFTPLAGTASVPIGALVDARKGSVTLTAATSGGTASAQLAAGIFTIRQQQGGVPELVMATSAGLAQACAPGRTPPRKGVVRTLSVAAKGTFRVVPKKGIVTGRNASWTTTDRCDGTVTRVRRGSVTVRNGHRTIRVRAGHAYVVRARLFGAKRAA